MLRLYVLRIFVVRMSAVCFISKFLWGCAIQVIGKVFRNSSILESTVSTHPCSFVWSKTSGTECGGLFLCRKIGRSFFIMLYRMMFCKIISKIFLSWFLCNEIFCFLSRIQKYHIFIARDRYCLISSLVVSEADLYSVYNCVMGFGCPNSSNMLLEMMTSLPVTKQPPVSASDAEATTNF